MILIAIDPGQSGGIAVSVNGHVQAITMPGTYAEMFKELRKVRLLGKEAGVPVRAVVESTCAMPGERVVSVRHFGEHMGHIEMALLALGIGMRKIAPITWQKSLSVPPLAKLGPRPEPGALEPREEFQQRERAWAAARARSKTVKKNAIKELAQERFPALKVTLRTADALMILDWALKQQPCEVES